VPKANQSGENTERFRAEMMLNDLDFLLHCFRAYPKKLQYFRQCLMAHPDMIRHHAAFRREGEATIFFVTYKAALGDTTNHVRDRRWAQVKRFGEVGHRRVTPFLESNS